MTKETYNKYKEVLTVILSIVGALITAFSSAAVYLNNLNVKLAQHEEKFIAGEKASVQLLYRTERMENKMDEMKDNLNKFKIEIIKELRK